MRSQPLAAQRTRAVHLFRPLLPEPMPPPHPISSDPIPYHAMPCPISVCVSLAVASSPFPCAFRCRRLARTHVLHSARHLSSSFWLCPQFLHTRKRALRSPSSPVPF